MSYDLKRIFQTQDCNLIFEGLHALFVFTESIKDMDHKAKQKLEKIIALQKHISEFNMDIVHRDCKVWVRFDGISPSSYIRDEIG